MKRILKFVCFHCKTSKPWETPTFVGRQKAILIKLWIASRLRQCPWIICQWIFNCFRNLITMSLVMAQISYNCAREDHLWDQSCFYNHTSDQFTITNSNAYQSVNHNTERCTLKWWREQMNNHIKNILLWWLPWLIKAGKLDLALTKHCLQELSNDLCCQWWLLRNVRSSFFHNLQVFDFLLNPRIFIYSKFEHFYTFHFHYN